MSDILVRVPKGEVDHFWDEIPDGNVAWWTLSSTPRRFETGEHVYFQIGNEVVARARVEEIRVDERVCEDTGRTWKGCHLVWSKGALERLPSPCEGTKLTRGFCYFSYTLP